jgi:hypothetical protein
VWKLDRLARSMKQLIETIEIIGFPDGWKGRAGQGVGQLERG